MDSFTGNCWLDLNYALTSHTTASAERGQNRTNMVHYAQQNAMPRNHLPHYSAFLTPTKGYRYG